MNELKGTSSLSYDNLRQEDMSPLKKKKFFFLPLFKLQIIFIGAHLYSIFLTEFFFPNMNLLIFRQLAVV